MTYPKRLLRMTMLLLVILAACTLKPKQMDISKLNDFAIRYTAAWCSHSAASVASFYNEKGSLKINEANPSVGRAGGVVARRNISYQSLIPSRSLGESW
jgi:hypothetical protein